MSRTQAGRDFVSAQMFGTPGLAAQVIALSDVSYAVPAAGANTHTTMGGNTTSEVTADGLGRALATYSHSAGAQTSTLQKTFTNTAAAGANPHTIYEVAVFQNAAGPAAGAANTGTLVFEMAEPNPPVLAGTDTLNQTVSIDFGS